MKAFVRIILLLPLAALAEDDLDYFNEYTEPAITAPAETSMAGPAETSVAKPIETPIIGPVEVVGPETPIESDPGKLLAPPEEMPAMPMESVFSEAPEPPEPPKVHPKSWGQGALDYIEKIAAPLFNSSPAHEEKHPSIKPVEKPNYPYLQEQQQLRLKEQEIVKIRQELLKTTDGHAMQPLVGTLNRLESERQRLLELLKDAPAKPTVAPMAAPTPPVEKVLAQHPKPVALHTNDEDILKAQLAEMTQQEAELQRQIKLTADANTLSILVSRLERVQQNKSLVILSLEDMQRYKLKHSKVGFGAALIPAKITEQTPMPSLTPSLGQILAPAATPLPLPPAPPAGAIPQPIGWNGFTPMPTVPEKPAGEPVIGDAWQKVQAQAEASFEDKQGHANYRAPKRPLWTPKDHLGANKRKSVVVQAPLDHRQIIEKVRKQKIFN